MFQVCSKNVSNGFLRFFRHLSMIFQGFFKPAEGALNNGPSYTRQANSGALNQGLDLVQGTLSWFASLSSALFTNVGVYCMAGRCDTNPPDNCITALSRYKSGLQLYHASGVMRLKARSAACQCYDTIDGRIRITTVCHTIDARICDKAKTQPDRIGLRARP